MIRVTCSHCKEEVALPFYFYDARIIVQDTPFSTTAGKDYTASALGRATCPECGEDIREQFTCPITRSDIIELATRREIHQ